MSRLPKTEPKCFELTDKLIRARIELEGTKSAVLHWLVVCGVLITLRVLVYGFR